jgi:hypothetical protein
MSEYKRLKWREKKTERKGIRKISIEKMRERERGER